MLSGLGNPVRFFASIEAASNRGQAHSCSAPPRPAGVTVATFFLSVDSPDPGMWKGKPRAILGTIYFNRSAFLRTNTACFDYSTCVQE
jgi:hypothetical protein